MLFQDYKRLFEENSEIKAIYKNGQIVWPKIAVENPYKEPFYFENTNSDYENLASIKKSSGNINIPTLTIEYSNDNINWNILGTTSTTALVIVVPPKSKVYLRCNADKWCATWGHGNRIDYNGGIGGNIMSLTYGEDFTGNEIGFKSNTAKIFCQMFYGSFINDISKLLLPATNLETECYADLFHTCNSLITAPIKLPATVLAEGCYRGMFADSRNLTTLPDLLAENLVSHCYYYMNQRCYALQYVRCLAKTGINTRNSTVGWMDGLTSGTAGTFVKAAGVTWPTGVNGIPFGWTVIEE